MFSSKLGKTKEMLEGLDGDELLEAMGLVRKSQQSSWIWPALGGLALGAACGVAVGMLLAPKKGSELREELGEKLGAGGSLLGTRVNEPPVSAGSPPGTSGRSGTAI